MFIMETEAGWGPAARRGSTATSSGEFSEGRLRVDRQTPVRAEFFTLGPPGAGKE